MYMLYIYIFLNITRFYSMSFKNVKNQVIKLNSFEFYISLPCLILNIKMFFILSMRHINLNSNPLYVYIL